MTEPTDGHRIRAVALPPEYLEKGAKLMAKKRADKLEPLTEAEIEELTRWLSKAERHRTFELRELDRGYVIIRKLLAEREADKAEVERLRKLLRRIDVRSDLGPTDPMYGDDLWDDINEAAEAAGGDDAKQD